MKNKKTTREPDIFINSGLVTRDDLRRVDELVNDWKESRSNKSPRTSKRKRAQQKS